MALILVVDDEPHIVKMVEFKLRNQGHETISAADGNQALEMALARKPDLILLDVMMPGLDGFQVLNKLKTRKETRELPVIMLTAKGQERDVLTGFDKGADDYIIKPFSFPELLARVNRALSKGENADK